MPTPAKALPVGARQNTPPVHTRARERFERTERRIEEFADSIADMMIDGGDWPVDRPGHTHSYYSTTVYIRIVLLYG